MKLEKLFEMESKKKKVLKIVVLGEAATGKTSIVRRYCEGTFLSGYKTTIGSDFYVKSLHINDGRINDVILSIWDLAGENRFAFMMETFMKGAKGALLVFDLSRKRTFIKLADWLQMLQRSAGSIPLILIGNKSDLIDSRFVSAMKPRHLLKTIRLLILNHQQKKIGISITSSRQ